MYIKNIIWVIVGIVGLAILLLLIRDEKAVPHVTLITDTTKVIVGNGETKGEVPFLENTPQNYSRKPSDEFLGKTYVKCLEMVYEWPDAQLIETNSGNQGIASIEFKVNENHHLLEFLDDKCVEDRILNK
ncbi:MAG: hypothetical protein FGM41_12760 [Bacteroidetes bacterium]|jgi:hypothetical protein|nr:hypothetical protein [Bacteroidota bacterium]